ncbi:MAG: 30S ribosome-binding factor RbfA [Lachnospiraceae bacterium]|nr:30S ribosome-binding factor RbfA [Lachnospiraceae bacterium]
MRKNSVKNIRINNEVQRELAELIRGGLKDPRISPMTSVVAVNVAPDLKTCKAYISVLGDEEAQRQTMEGLKSASGFIRSTLAKNLNLRNTPVITFIPEQSIEYWVEMSAKIDQVIAQIPDREEEERTDSEQTAAEKESVKDNRR